MITAARRIVGVITHTDPASASGIAHVRPETRFLRDAVHGGAYRVTGTVKITPATPAFRKVSLFDSVSRIIIREQWSDPVTGVYAFNNIRAGTFFVVSVDHTGSYNAVIADRLVAELMP
jgi:hypothetical protein